MAGQTSSMRALGLLDVLPVGILVSRFADGTVIFANRRASEAFGVESGCVPGLTATALYRRVEERDAVIRALRRVREVKDAEFEMCRVDGGSFWVRASAVLARDPEGELAIAVFNDVTAERNAEQRLRTAYRMEAFRRIAGGLAHEVNNALVPILTFGELAMAEVDSHSLVREHLERVMAAANRCSDVVGRVMEFSGPAGSERVTVDLRAIVDRAGKLLRAAAPRRIDVDIAVPEGAVQVDVAAELEETILVVALDATDAYADGATGRVSLNLEIEEVEANRGAALGLTSGVYAHLVVEDDGAPIVPDAIERAFDPLITDRDTPLGRHHGLGLAYRTAVAHGGAVEVDSQPSTGTRVAFWLPVTPGNIPPHGPDTERTP